MTRFEELFPLKRALFCYAAPGLLLLVAGLQQHLVRRYDLTPWKGGGFGMFAVIDGPNMRKVRASIIAERDGQVQLYQAVIPSRFDRLVLEAQHFPADSRLERLAQALLAERWVVQAPSESVAIAINPVVDDARAGNDQVQAQLQGQVQGGAKSNSGFPQRFQPQLRALEPYERAEPQKLLQVRLLRIEYWKHRFDGASVTVSSVLKKRFVYRFE